jgi:hypothetical protein
VSYDDDDTGIANALFAIATHVKYLGVGNASTQMGAIEFLAINIERGLVAIASAIDRHSAAIEKASGDMSAVTTFVTSYPLPPWYASMETPVTYASHRPATPARQP